ncbi:MAG: hypothetical protein GY862_33270, partial [Gammaproteobacteria bacterium]|nr:hypothetical protein [Gammaproteobacteria bacterium]
MQIWRIFILCFLLGLGQEANACTLERCCDERKCKLTNGPEFECEPHDTYKCLCVYRPDYINCCNNPNIPAGHTKGFSCPLETSYDKCFYPKKPSYDEDRAQSNDKDRCAEYAYDPIDLSAGAQEVRYPLLNVRGVLPVRLSLRHDSLLLRYDPLLLRNEGLLGTGWEIEQYEAYLERDGTSENVNVYWSPVRFNKFIKGASGNYECTHPACRFTKLQKTGDGKFVLHKRSQIYTFCADGRLKSLGDIGNPHALTLIYTDAEGRSDDDSDPDANPLPCREGALPKIDDPVVNPLRLEKIKEPGGAYVAFIYRVHDPDSDHPDPGFAHALLEKAIAVAKGAQPPTDENIAGFPDNYKTVKFNYDNNMPDRLESIEAVIGGEAENIIAAYTYDKGSAQIQSASGMQEFYNCYDYMDEGWRVSKHMEGVDAKAFAYAVAASASSTSAPGPQATCSAIPKGIAYTGFVYQEVFDEDANPLRKVTVTEFTGTGSTGHVREYVHEKGRDSDQKMTLQQLVETKEEIDGQTVVKKYAYDPDIQCRMTSRKDAGSHETTFGYQLDGDNAYIKTITDARENITYRRFDANTDKLLGIGIPGDGGEKKWMTEYIYSDDNLLEKVTNTTDAASMFEYYDDKRLHKKFTAYNYYDDETMKNKIGIKSGTKYEYYKVPISAEEEKNGMLKWTVPFSVADGTETEH